MKNILSFFASVKFSIVLILLIIFTSAIGTFFDKSNIYSSKVFIILLILFSVNLVLCTLKLLPFAKHGFIYKKNVIMNNNLFTNLTTNDIVQKLKAMKWHVSLHDGVVIAAKHEVGRYGVIILHFGVILTLFGGLMAHLYGFKAFMNVLEGSSDNVAVFPDGTLKELGFEVRLDDFNVEYYKDSNHAKSYTSKVTVVEDGVEKVTKIIDVNTPFKYKGISFYQTSFGFYPNRQAIFTFDVRWKDNVTTYKIKFDELTNLSGTPYSLKVTDFAPTLTIDKKGRYFSQSEELLNPAIFVEVFIAEKLLSKKWVLMNSKKSGEFITPNIDISFSELYGLQYSGLSVKKDSSVFLVYCGFAAVMLGIILIYFFNYTAIFFRLEDNIIYYKILKQRKFSFINACINIDRLAK